MPLLNGQDRYGSIEIGLHWLVFALMIAVYASIELKGFFPKGSPWRDQLLEFHGSVGLTVFALTIPRLLLRWTVPRPAIVPPLTAHQQKLAEVTHWLLYALIIVLPVTGYLLTNLSGKPVTMFGAALPDLVGQSKSVGKAVKEIHEFLANAGYALIGLHAGAALFHHYFQRDNTLRRMLPFV